ncbi:MAG: tetratricopeptide repeat protein [Planctomycetota bacterium]|nr:MAG: tetratricopeptide repeat protein [Planctomycetota bacterium]
MRSTSRLAFLATLSLFAPALPLAAAPAAALELRVADVQKLLDDGRALLDKGDADGALKLFEQAAAAEKDSLRTRTWVVRAWLEQGRINDARDAADELDRAHKGAPEVAYLYGFASLKSAEQKIASGRPDATVGFDFQDAVANLKEALASKRPEFKDGWLALSRAAWNAQDHATALAAGEEAVKAYPKRADAWRQLASAALASHIATAESDKAAAAKHVARAIDACQTALSLTGEPKDAAGERTRADIELALGDALLWKGDAKAGGAAYARALALDPAIADPGALWKRLGNEEFLSAITSALDGFGKRHGATDARAGTLAWWNGSACFSLGKHEDAEKAFARALELAPNVLSSWYYLARVRTSRGDGMAAAEALRKFKEANQAELMNWLAYEAFAKDNQAMLAWISGNCFRKAETLRTEGKLIESMPCIEAALVVSEIRAAWTPEDPEAWSNIGLFTRDQGDVTNLLRRQKKDLPDPKPLWERAFAAYEKSLALDDTNPNTLNDAAVILHYNLRRDFPKARAMYQKAIARAEEQLAKPDLDPAVRKQLTEELIVWANDNLKKLDADEKKAAEKPADADGDAGQ